MQLGGRFADRNLAASIMGVFGANALIYLTLPYAMGDPASALAAMFLWGLVFYAIAAPIQVRVVTVAYEAPSLASTLVQSGFNLGNAVGPALGGAALSAGLGTGFLPEFAATLATAGVLIALVSLVLERRGEPQPS